MSLRFPVKVDGRHSETEIDFATEAEVLRLARWRRPRVMPEDAVTARKISDAVDFAKLASNRWRDYQRAGEAVSSMEELVEAIQKAPAVELATVLIARPTWRSAIPTLGFAYLRRTWCHHLFLEFLATHPRVIGRKHEIIGWVGVSILHKIVSIAKDLDIPCIWGEATEISASWYQEQLNVVTVGDSFFIEGEVMQHCQKEMQRSQKEMLARRDKM
jgi:hypothetical protein